jgi:DNA-binding transcriptional MerR regulator
MLSIGEFARLGGVSVRTLHHYEDVGVLEPVSVNQKNGYRSYSAHQLPRLHRIIALKELGLSLSQLRPMLDELSPATLRGMLLMKRMELEDQVNADQSRLARVEQRLRSIEREDAMEWEILLKDVPEQRVAAVRVDRAGLSFGNLDETWHEELGVAFFTLAERLDAAGATDHGPAFSFYQLREDGDLIPHVAVDLGGSTLAGDDVIHLTLAAVKVVSTVIDYTGAVSHQTVGPIYGDLARWAEDHGYDVVGPGRDILISLDDGVVMEHQLPVTTRSAPDSSRPAVSTGGPQVQATRLTGPRADSGDG